MSKSKIITLQKTIYLSGQDREEGACVSPYSNIKDIVHRVIMSDKKMNRGEYNWQDKKPWEYYPNYVNQKAKIDYHDGHGWNGLMKVMPYLDRDENVECLVTVQFETKDVSYWDEEHQIEKYNADEIKELGMYNFHCESDFYAVTEDNGYTMICKGQNSLDWEIDDGYVKWDCDRQNGGWISDDSPLADMFPGSNTDGHGVGEPYKIRIIVDAIV